MSNHRKAEAAVQHTDRTSASVARSSVIGGVLATAAMLVMMGLTGCSDNDPVTKGGVGTTLDMMTDGVRLRVTLVKVQDTGSGTTVQFTANDPDHSKTANIKKQSFVAVDGSGTWSFPVQGAVVNAHPPDAGHNIGPGQTVTGLMTFQVTGMTHILYNGAGFVVNAQGDPVNGGSAYYEGSWTVSR
ncbi:hypothetical protein [Streptomyces sp. NPDC014806]|uniref:hypothetical protein n=1 Tax=Streptomyces sp. NPDC014806 TaxID=3364920 RepID=UPI003702FEED